jgi:ABC-type nitrate/sulfonate/bicarbonate transport system substrate-binding protein
MVRPTERGLSRTLSIVIVAIIIVAAAGGAGAYVLSTTSHPPPTSKSLTDVSMGFAGVPDVTDTPGFMLWQTYAQQLGLNIHVQYYDGDQTVAAAVVAGNVQIGEGGFQAILSADEKIGNSSGAYPFVVFGTYEAADDFGLLVADSFNGHPIHSVSDLAGLPIAVSSTGSTSDIFCHLLLSQGGVSMAEQNCKPSGGTPSRYNALISGQVAGDITEPFYMVDAVERGGFQILATVPAVVPNLLFSSLYVSRTFAQQHPDIVLKVEEATLMADRWAHNETLWIQKEQEEFPGTNVTIAGAAWKIWMAMNIWAPNGGLSVAALNYSANFYVSIHKVAQYLAPKYWADLSYQQKALQALGNYTTCPVLKGCADPKIPSLSFPIPGVSSAILPLTTFFVFDSTMIAIPARLSLI